MTPRIWRWLESTKALQREAYGYDWDAIGHDLPLVTESLKDNLFAALVEFGEASREFSWKQWARDEPFINRQKLLMELIDVAHFMGNMLLALGVTDEEWEAAYQEKQQINRERQIRGYAVKDKEKE